LRQNLIIYHLLSQGGVYQDLGATYLDSLQQERVRQRLVQRLQALGYEVSVVPATPTPQIA